MAPNQTKIHKARQSKKSQNSRSFAVWLCLILVAAILLSAYLLSTHNSKQSTASGEIKATMPSEQTTGKKSAATTSTPAPDSAKNGSSSSSAAVIKDPPTGTFVSNHHPSLAGTSRPSSEQSTCVTVPGATCYIQFTKGDIVKTLPTKTADSDGSVIWNWDVSTAGFTEGTWKITAVAQAGGKTFEATDSMNLEVQP
jgi:hypothetical protein